MSQTIDSRVVEMRFDNKQFEAGAKTSMSTLSRLKEALKLPDSTKALEGIDKATKNIKLDGISAGIEALERRFSTLGIVGMRVIENITDGLMNKVSAAVNFVSDSIVSGGIKRAMNIENAHFQLQALLKDEEKVQAVMANAMESVDGTAYAYDEAAKAASQFAASGIQAGEDMLNALRGITGVAAMTNSSFEDISRVFTTVAGNGRLMGDQLLQLSSRGLNAASTIAEYFREVRGETSMTEADIREFVSKGQISFKTFSDAMTWAFGDSAKRANETFTGSMSNMKSALARIGAEFVSPLIEQNGELVKMFNALRIKINDVKSGLTFNQQRSAISGLAEVTKMTNDELSEMFDTIKTNGKVSIKDLDTLKTKGADATAALAKYVNGVTDGSVRASYAITTALNDLTNGTKVSTSDIKRFVMEGKIDLATFTAAMETEFGNEKTLSKQFTDFFLDNIHKLVVAINSADVTKPLQIFYYWFESIKNVVKGLLYVVSPVAKAFKEIFLSFDSDDVISFSEAVEKLTAKLKLSEKGSNNLHDAFKGLFSVVKLLIDIFVKLLGAIVPINEPVLEMGDGFLSLFGAMGRGLSSFTDMIRSSETLRKVFEKLSSGFSFVVSGISKMIKTGKEFVLKLSEMEGTTKLINAIGNAFEKLYTSASPYMKSFIDQAEKIFSSLFNFEDINIDSVLETISKAFSNLADSIENFSFQTVTDAFDALKEKIKSLGELFMSNDGIFTFVTNAKQFGEDLKEAFSWDSIMERLEKIMDVFGKFFSWVKETFNPALENFSLEDFNIGALIAGGTGLAIIKTVLDAFKSFKNITAPLQSLGGLLGSVKGTLVAYQKDLKADTLMKIAAAIALLAGAITILSFADTERAWNAAIMLTMIGAGLVVAVGYFVDVVKKTKTVDDAIFMLTKAGNNLAKAVKWKAIASVVKQFGNSILKIALSIIALGVMYTKDSEAFAAGSIAVGVIAGALLGIIGIFAALGKKLDKGTENFSKVGKSLLMLSASVYVIVTSLNKLFKMEFPDGWGVKLAVLAGLMVGVGVLALILGLAGRIAGGGSFSGMAGLKLPDGLKWAKSFISSSNGGSLSAAPILAIAGSLYIVVAALNKLFKMEFPDDYEKKLWIFAGLMGGLAVLMLMIGAAGKLAGGSLKATGTILALTVFIAAVVGSLYVLSIMPWQKLLTGAVTLGIVLLALGGSLALTGKLTNQNSYKTVLAMALTIGAITAALAVLAMVPWEKLLKAGVALGSILLVLSKDFEAISKTNAKDSIVAAISMIGMIVTIAYSLYVLAEQPWENLLAAAGSLSLVLIALAGCFGIIGKINPDLELIGAFAVASSLLVAIVALSLYELSRQPWENLLAAAGSLSFVLIALAGCLAILTATRADLSSGIDAALALSSFVAILTVVMTALGALFSQDIVPLEEWLDKGIEILVKVGNGLGRFVGAIVEGIITQVSNSLPIIGQNLSNFWDNASNFFEGLGNMSDDIPAKAAKLAGALIALTAAELIGAIGSFLGINFISFGVQLSAFMEAAEPFFSALEDIKPETLEATKTIGAMVLALTAADVINGIAGFFGISGSLSKFGEELKAFGEPIRDFSEMVKDVKPEAVQGAANAAEIMATTASKLQGHGGFIQKIMGEKSLASFAEELDAFGPSISSFAKTVTGVKESDVKGAAAAAEIMATMAEKLPNQGGLSAKIFGDNTLSTFGEELDKFGEKFVPFCEKVSGIQRDAVEGAANAAEIMVTLANKLPNSGSWLDIFGGGKMSLSDFGVELEWFGMSMSNFANTISAIQVEQVNGVIASLEDLLNLGTLIQNGSGEALVTFSSQLGQLSIDSIEKFANAFSDGTPTGTYAVTTFFNAIVNEITAGGMLMDQNSLEITKNFLTTIQTTITSHTPIIVALEQGLVDLMIKTFDLGLPAPTFMKIGERILQTIENGLISRRNSIMGTINTITATIRRGFETNLSSSHFTYIGANAAEGLRGGIESKIGQIGEAAARAAREAVEAAKRALSIHSPSKVMEEIGGFFSKGFAGGIIKESDEISDATERVTKTAVDQIRDAMKMISDGIENGEFDYDPTIKPIMDISDLKNRADEIRSLFEGMDAFSTTTDLVVSNSSKFNNNKAKIEENNQNKRFEDKLDKLMKEKPEESKTEIHNTFYIQSTDPKEAAEEVGYIIQHKVERGKAAWGK